MTRVLVALFAFLGVIAHPAFAQNLEFDVIDEDLVCALWQLGGYTQGQAQTRPDTAPMLFMLFGVPSRGMARDHGYNKATLVGNAGSGEVEVRWGPQSVAIIETTMSGSQHTLTLLSAYDEKKSMSLLEYVATYTRHTIPLALPSEQTNRQPIISQYRGRCVPWSVATGRFPDGVDRWPSLPPVLKRGN